VELLSWIGKLEANLENEEKLREILFRMIQKKYFDIGDMGVAGVEAENGVREYAAV
jgi:hypothetical protein